MYLEISKLLILTKTIIIIINHFNVIVVSTLWTVYRSSLKVGISYCIVFFWNVETRLKDLSHAIFCWMACLRRKQLIVSVIMNIRITHYAQRCFSDNWGISVHAVAIRSPLIGVQVTSSSSELFSKWLNTFQTDLVPSIISASLNGKSTAIFSWLN